MCALQTSSLHDELLNSIWEPDTRSEVEALLNHSIVAVSDLSSMDQAIYEHYKKSGTGDLAAQGNADLILTALKEATLSGLRGLDSYLEYKGYLAAALAEDSDMDMEWDFGEMTGSPNSSEGDNVNIDDDAIDDALDVLAPEKTQSNPEKWRHLKKELGSVAYGLHAQLADFEARFDNALRSNNYGAAMRELDDTRNSLTDGIFALLATMCEAYLGEVDRAQLIPGHRNTLQKALLVRRGIADLRRSVNPRNFVIQDKDSSTEDKQYHLERLVEILSHFINGEVFGAMRPADRFTLLKFRDDLSGQPVKAVRLDCEGLDKYLDSLAIVNQRDVLIQHDREVMKDISELLEAAKPLLAISPKGAVDLVKQAFKMAKALFGRREPLDALLISFRLDPPDLENPQEVEDIAQRLDELIEKPS
jgi:hypothetical protein